MQSILNNIRRPDITFYPNGRIDITARVAGMLSLESGDVIDILHDGREFYIYVRAKRSQIIGRFHGQVHPTNLGKSRNYRAFSIQMTNYILSHCHATTARLPVGEPLQLSVGTALPIITNCLLR